MNLKKLLLFFISLFFPIAPSFAMEMEQQIHEIIAEKIAANKYNISKNPNIRYNDLCNQLLEPCKQYEEQLSRNEKPKPRIDLPHGLNYTMSKQDIEQSIKIQFDLMKKNGLIIDEDQFEKIRNQYKPLSCRNPTLISGTDYLTQYISKCSELKDSYTVSQYILVIPKNVKKIKVATAFNYPQMPYINTLKYEIDDEISDVKIYIKEDTDYGKPHSDTPQNLKDHKLDAFISISAITKHIYKVDNESYFISGPSLYNYLAYLTDKCPQEQNDFEDYAHQRFLYDNEYSVLSNYAFEYDLTGSTDSQTQINNNLDNNTKATNEEPKNANNFFFKKLHELYAWTGKHKKTTFCLVAGTGMALYYVIIFALNHK